MSTIISFAGGDVQVTEDYDALLSRIQGALDGQTLVPSESGPGVTMSGFLNATLRDGTRIAVQASSIAYVRPG